MTLSFTARLFPVLFCLLFTFSGAAQVVDSVWYHKEWLYVYPFEQRISMTSEGTFSRTNDKLELFVPVIPLPDGKYIQLVSWSRSDFNFNRRHNMHGVKRIKRPKWYGKKSKEQLVYAVFHITGGELNGEAFFFDAYGNRVEKGEYQNNLKQGKWYYGAGFTSYHTFKDGALDGLSHDETIYKGRKGKNGLLKSCYDVNYIAGVAGSSIQYLYYADSSRMRIESNPISFSQNGRPLVYEHKTYLNDQLIKAGPADGIYKTGVWRYYYPETGQLKAEMDFTVGRFRSDNLLTFWINHFIPEAQDSFPLKLYGIGLRDKYNFDPENDGIIPSAIKKPGNFQLYAGGAQYYPNGQKMISFYPTLSNEIFVDTLFHSNGAPRYVVIKDSATKELVARYFDKEGTLYDEKRDPFAYYYPPPADWLVYEDHKLTRFGSVDNFIYRETPTFDSISNPKNGIMYSRIVSDGKVILEESFFEPQWYRHTQRVRLGNYGAPVNVETVRNYNETYTSAAVTRTVTFAERFKVICTYDAQYNPLPVLDSSLNLVEFERASTSMDVRKLQEHIRNKTAKLGFNYRDPVIKISNQQTTYYLDNAPLSAAVRVKFGSGETGLKMGKREIYINLQNAWSMHHEDFFLIFDHDRFNMQSLFGKSLLLPDLMSCIKIYEGYRIREFGSFHEELREARGTFLNGKFHGVWEIYNYEGEKYLQANFDQGKPIGKWSVYETDEVYNKRYISQQSRFDENGRMNTVFYNFREDTLTHFVYQNNLPVEKTIYRYLDNGYEPLIYGGEKEKDPDLQKYLTQSAHFENGELVGFVRTDFETGEVQQIGCENEMLHGGPIEVYGDSGSFDHGLFSGILHDYYNDGVTYKRYVQQGLFTQKESYTQNNILNWRIVFDTSLQEKCRTNSLMGYEFLLSRAADKITYCEAEEPLWGQYQSWYTDGSKHASGAVKNRDTWNEKLGTWNYYDPAGNNRICINYDVRYNKYLDDLGFNSYGECRVYTNEKLQYVGHVLYETEKYNCDANEYYEIRTLYIEKDIDSNGHITLNPTRYHRNFYDTGVLQSEGNLINGLPGGLWKYYDAAGALNAIGSFKAGRYDGTWYYGDLTGLNFLGDYCVKPDLKNLQEKLDELSKELEIDLILFDNGKQISRTHMSAVNNR